MTDAGFNEAAKSHQDNTKERPKFITYRMRCGRSIKVLDTPQARANAKRMGWVEIK